MDLSPKAVKARRERARYTMTYSGKQVTIEVEEYEALLEMAAEAVKWKNLCVRPGFQALEESVDLVKAIEVYEFTMHYMPDQRLLDRARQIPDGIKFIGAESGEILEDFETLTLDWDQKLYIAAKSIEWRQSLRVTLERVISKAIRQYVDPEFVGEYEALKVKEDRASVTA